MLDVNGKKTVESFHRDLGKIMWDNCGMSRNKKDLESAITSIKDLKKEFWNNVFVPGKDTELNPELEKAGRVADFIELGELMIHDALDRNESCGGHFREEYQTSEGKPSETMIIILLFLPGNIREKTIRPKGTKRI